MHMLGLKRLIRKVIWYVRSLFGKDVWVTKDITIPHSRLGEDGGDRIVAHEYLDAESIVYSVGIGRNISFDQAMIERFGCTIHAFDPTPDSLAWVEQQETPEQFNVYGRGLARESGEVKFFAPQNKEYISHTMCETDDFSQEYVVVPVKSLKDTISELGHTEIDLIKMDIEGAEYEVIAGLFDDNIAIRQILVEVHHRFAAIPPAKTRDLNSLLRSKGYQLFGISPTGQEYSWIRSE